ncbi:ABC transporter substrate-binding protein [Oceanobacter antarcticus]|uniref:ABC transporter substrate-binding protein n=1 Tax=Oceanobacter antarcticus TaxID=3133425 RepID=A0ABW8NG22_9GAMM
MMRFIFAPPSVVPFCFFSRRWQQALAAVALLWLIGTMCDEVQASPAAISDDVVKIGVMADMSGVYATVCGEGCVTAATMAVEDFGETVLGKPIEVVSADDHNSPESAALQAKTWVEREQVDVITGLVASSVTAAVTAVTNAAQRIVLISGSGSDAFTTSACSPYIAHWTYDVVALANGTVKPMVEAGKKKWFFITADYAFGLALEEVATRVVTTQGGVVTGSVRVPFGTADFAPYVRQAAASGADVVALANAGEDFVNALRAAADIGLTQSMEVVGLLVFTPNVKALDPAITANMRLTTGFYWDRDDSSRVWSERFFARAGVMPTMVQAGVYSAVSHYLNSIRQAGSDTADVVMKAMKSTRPNDFFAQRARLRPDGRLLHDMYQVRIKTARERKNPDDLYAIENVVHGIVAFAPPVPSCLFRKHRATIRE